MSVLRSVLYIPDVLLTGNPQPQLLKGVVGSKDPPPVSHIVVQVLEEGELHVGDVDLGRLVDGRHVDVDEPPGVFDGAVNVGEVFIFHATVILHCFQMSKDEQYSVC